LKLDDLTKGKPVFRIGLPAEALGLKWNADGSRYAVLFDSAAVVYDGPTGKELTVLRPPRGTRLNDMLYLSASGNRASAASRTAAAAAPAVGDDALTGFLVLAAEGSGSLFVFPDNGAVSAKGETCRLVDTGNAAAKRIRALAFCDETAAAAAAATATPAAPASAASLNPLSKLNQSVNQNVTVSGEAPYVATVDSDCLVKLFPAGALLAGMAQWKLQKEHRAAQPSAKAVLSAGASAFSSAGSLPASAPAVVPEKIAALAPAATLNAAQGSRPTCLVASICTTSSKQQDKPKPAPAGAAAAVAGKHHKQGDKKPAKEGLAAAAAAVAAAATAAKKQKETEKQQQLAGQKRKADAALAAAEESSKAAEEPPRKKKAKAAGGVRFDVGPRK
jgi:hypothetical protein